MRRIIASVNSSGLASSVLDPGFVAELPSMLYSFVRGSGEP